jgi:hypothetical protein
MSTPDDAEQPPANNANGTAKAISKLISQINVPTLVTILAMNGWGIKTTEQTSKERETQIYHALDQIRDLHRSLDDFERRQKQTVENVSAVLSGQAQTLKNQTQLLQNQQQILNDLNKWQQDIKKSQ